MFSQEKTYSTQERIPSLDKGLEQIDFVMIEDIFTKILTKAGVDRERLLVIFKDLSKKIEEGGLLSYFDKNTAIYFSDEDKIVFSKHISPQKFQDFISTLVHELLHMVSDISKGENTTPENYESRVGLDERWYGGKFLGLVPFYEGANTLLNEGVTQLVAEAITYEYFRRQGEKAVDIRNEERNIYLSGKAVVELLTKSIASRTGVPEDIVFQAIVRSMLNYDYDEFLDLVSDDPVLEEFVKKIGGLYQKDLESTALLERFGLGERKVVLDTLKVQGLEDVFEKVLNGRARKRPKEESMDDFYFNPFYDNLK